MDAPNRWRIWIFGICVALVVPIGGCAEPNSAHVMVSGAGRSQLTTEAELTAREIVSVDSIASCLAIEAWKRLDEERRKIFPPPTALEVGRHGLDPQMAEQAIKIALPELAEAGFKPSLDDLIFAEEFAPLEGAVMLWMNFDDRVTLPHQWGLPVGDRAEDGNRLGAEHAGGVEPVAKEEVASLFLNATAAQVVVSIETSEIAWVLPMKKPMLCPFP